jgi:transposase
MFVRKKRNKSGSVSVQIIDKSSGRFVVYQTVGSSSDPMEVAFLVEKAKEIILKHGNQTIIPFYRQEELQYVDTFLNGLDSFALIGPELLLGKIFDEIGLHAIPDSLFRHLVITRLIYPVSKLKTTDYLFKYKGIDVSVYSIYRYLDKLHSKQLEAIKNICLEHTLSILGGVISIVFYDVTTLYFEASDEDDLRKTGYSKDGKHQCPQILLGLLVSSNGYPIDYHIFEGNKYEGDTLLPVIEHFESKHKLEKIIVVADSGLLSQKNIQQLKDKQYEYILGARIKNTKADITQQILSLRLSDKQNAQINLNDTERLIISFKNSRAIRDAKNRKRGMEKLEKQLKSGKLSKVHLNNRGYNKYLKVQGEAELTIDYDKYTADAQWDGLKGYQTNTSLSKEQVIEQYSQLWEIERTFRISKSDLQIRPIYHRLHKRIEAHVCISFAACKVYKELERQLAVKKAGLSAEKTIDILKTIYKISIQTPYSHTIYHRLLVKTEEQKRIVDLFGLKI